MSVLCYTVINNAVAQTSYSVVEVQEMLDTLPSANSLSSYNEEEQTLIYNNAQNIYDMYELLTESEKALIDTYNLEQIFEYFNSGVSTTADYQIIMGYDKNEKNGGFLILLKLMVEHSLVM